MPMLPTRWNPPTPDSNLADYNRVGGAFAPLSHHRTCLLWHTAVSRRVFSPGTTIPAATLYLSSSDTLTPPPHRYVDSHLPAFHSSVEASYISVLLGSAAVCSEIWAVAHAGFSPSHRGCSFWWHYGLC